MHITPAEILKEAEKKHGSLCAVARKTGLQRSTLKRIKNGSTNAPHEATIAKLVRAIARGE